METKSEKVRRYLTQGMSKDRVIAKGFSKSLVYAEAKKLLETNTKSSFSVKEAKAEAETLEQRLRVERLEWELEKLQSERERVGAEKISQERQELMRHFASRLIQGCGQQESQPASLAESVTLPELINIVQALNQLGINWSKI